MSKEIKGRKVTLDFHGRENGKLSLWLSIDGFDEDCEASIAIDKTNIDPKDMEAETVRAFSEVADFI